MGSNNYQSFLSFKVVFFKNAWKFKILFTVTPPSPFCSPPCTAVVYHRYNAAGLNQYGDSI